MSRTLLLELRDAAKVEPDAVKRQILLDIADDLDDAIYNFSEYPSTENLTDVNGCWASGVRALGYASHLDPDGGSREAA